MPNSIDTARRKYVALRVLKISSDQFRDVGEEVPEAQSWDDSVIKAMLHTGQLGEGPICDHSDQLAAHEQRLAGVESQVSELVASLRQAISERDAAYDERDSVVEENDDLKLQLGAKRGKNKKTEEEGE